MSSFSISKAYLKKKPKELFWGFWLGIPYLIWLYSIVFELNKKLPKYKLLNQAIFFVLAAYILVCFLIAPFILLYGDLSMDQIQPYHYCGIFCSFSLMILASITIVRFEKQQGLKLSNVWGLFFGIWYFIFGIWDIQPKLNKYVKLLD